MRKAKIAAILIMCVMLAGCGMAIKVTHRPLSLGENQKFKKLPGVPFYTKVVTCKHETVWLEQTYKLTLNETTLDGKKTLFSRTMEITEDGYSSEELSLLRNQIYNHDSADNIRKTFESLSKYVATAIGQNGQDFDFFKPPQGHKFILMSNQNEPSVYVDYTDPHYLNARVPFAGTANPDITLSDELTLSKANVKIEEKTLETFIGPAKELLSEAIAVAGKTNKTQQLTPEAILIDLKTELQVYKYTLSTMNEKNAEFPCKHPTDILHNTIGVTFSRTLLPAEEPKKKEEEGNTLKFSGSVDLPKQQSQPSGSK